MRRELERAHDADEPRALGALSGELALVPLTERQQIVVVPDEALSDDDPYHAHQVVQGNFADWLKRHLPSADVEQPPDPRVQSARELREDGIFMLPVRASDASTLLMPVGHPRIGVVYVCDPADPMRYWPAADFHRRVFEHKFAEAARLVMALGATEMQVRSQRGWTGDVAAGIVASLPGVIRRSVSGGARAEREQELLLEARLAPTGLPRLPHGLIWYGQEPSWRMIAEGRLERGLSEFTLTISATDDYGINGAFADKAGRKKLLSFGGEFTAHKSTLWTIEGTFAPIDAPDAVASPN